MHRPFINSDGEPDHDLAIRPPLDVLFELDGLYICPKDADTRLGPLVGYAGRDDQDRQYVGDMYANCGEAEQWPWVYQAWMRRLAQFLVALDIDAYMGMPMGGIWVAGDLASVMRRRRIYAEKKVIALATASSREKSKLMLGRHSVRKGEQIAVCEDVTNNFSTTGEACELVEGQGGNVVAIVTVVNRADTDIYFYGDRAIPVMALHHKPMPQYEQDDPAVADDVAAGNVVLKPKSEWPRLKAIMEKHKHK